LDVSGMGQGNDYENDINNQEEDDTNISRAQGDTVHIKMEDKWVNAVITSKRLF
jgi:hypothetical protein